MEIIITGKDFALTPSIKRFIMTKAQRLAKIDKRIIQMKFELDVERHHRKGDNFSAEGWISVPGNDLQAGEKAVEMHAAIDIMIDKLASQLRKRKELRVDRKRKQA